MYARVVYTRKRYLLVKCYPCARAEVKTIYYTIHIIYMRGHICTRANTWYIFCIYTLYVYIYVKYKWGVSFTGWSPGKPSGPSHDPQPLKPAFRPFGFSQSEAVASARKAAYGGVMPARDRFFSSGNHPYSIQPNHPTPNFNPPPRRRRGVAAGKRKRSPPLTLLPLCRRRRGRKPPASIDPVTASVTDRRR